MDKKLLHVAGGLWPDAANNKRELPRARLVVISLAELRWGSMSRQRLHIFYSGRVQGVGFRHATKMVATGFELTGVVRNLADGRVELMAEGERAELEAFLKAIEDSAVGGLIRQAETNWVAAKNEFRGFEIVR